VEGALALLYALSILSWCVVARRFGPGAAIVTAAALLSYPGYAMLFHALSTDALFAAGLAFTAPLVVRVFECPSPGRAGVLGGAVAALVLVRPANQVLIPLFALFPLLAGGGWRTRLLGSGAFVVAAVVPLVAWATHNYVRADDFTVARGGGVTVPFFRVFVEDRIVQPDNGPASRELARAVARELLPREPYRSYGIDLDEFFSYGSARMHEDFIGLSDRVWGWDDDYAHVARAAREAVRAHPGDYARGVARDIYRLLWWPLLAAAPARVVANVDDGAGEPDTIVVAGRRLPRPTEGEPIPAARQSGFVSTPDGRIREVWTSPTAHRVVFRDRADALAAAKLDRKLDELTATFSDGEGTPSLRGPLNDLSRLYPRPLMWLVLGLVAVGVRRPRGARVPLALAAAALVLVASTALAVYAVAEYTVPVAPAFVLLAAVGLCGTGRRSRRGDSVAGTIVAPE
jgi:hypothetical protein